MTFILVTFTAFSYDWPLTNGQTQHQINSSFGEYRNGYFHNGIDIQTYTGQPIVALEGGTAHISGERINIGHFSYFHVIPSSNITDEQYVNAGEIIGVTSTGHLHFAESVNIIETDDNIRGNECINPLRVGGIAPFTDNGAPVIDNIVLYRQDTNYEVVQPNILHGKVDICIQAHDPGVAANGNINNVSSMGIYSIEIQILNDQSQVIGNTINYIRFDHLPNNSEINWAFANGSALGTNIYWATNDPFHIPYNKYLNTKQRINSNYDIDASYPGDLLYPEGNLKLRVIVYDIDGNIDYEDIGL